MPKISVGRDQEDRKEHGLEGTGVIGKHLVGENEEAHKANPIYFDLARPHVMGIFGKRGTGKCLLPDEKVLTPEGLKPVVELYNQSVREGEAEIAEKDEQLYRFEGKSVQSVGEKFSIQENQIKAAYSKKVDEKLLRIKTRSGREITVTREHPLLTLNGWKNSAELAEGERIGIPRRIELNFEDGELEIPEEFEKADYSCLNRRESEMLGEGNAEISDISDGTGSYSRMVSKADSKNLIDLSDGNVRITEKGKKELETRKEGEYYRYGKARPIKLPEKVSPELGEFFAYLIAEGHEQKITENNYRLMFTNKSEEVLERFEELGEKLFELEIKEMGKDTLYDNSRALEKFFEENGYSTNKNSFGKKIPDFIVTAGEQTAARFLQKYFDCEANVTEQQIDLITASKDIAEAINYMLLRFGIVGRTSVKEKYASNTEEQRVREYYQVTVSGSKFLENFRERIGFSIERKAEKLDEAVEEGNTNIDTVPCGDLIRKCREEMGADRTQVSKFKQSLKAYEDGKYSPSRQKLQDIASRLSEQLNKIESLIERVEKQKDLKSLEKLVEESGIKWKELNRELGYSRSDRRFLSYKKHRENPEKLVKPTLKLFRQKHSMSGAREKLQEIRSLSESDVFWDEIESIREIDYEGWVYDLTVEENHSFTAGFGGILCHNSYSMGTIAEEIQSTDVAENLSTIIIDSMGIYWSMKRPNDRATNMLDEWELDPASFDAKVYIPEGKVDEFEREEMPYDDTFTLNPADFTAQEWAMAFNIDINSERGILLERVISKLEDETDDYSIESIVKAIRKFDFPEEVEEGLVNRFVAAQDWGVFGEESSLEKFTSRGELSIVDVSAFGEMSSGWSVRSLIVGLLAKRILRRRMTARRIEEIDEMKNIAENEMPITWMLIDEAHEFIPADGKTPASDPLMRWVKIGREPGVSLVLATQQPAKLHPDALSQCDIVLSHRLTAKQDIDALGEIMQTYMRYDLQHYIDALPDRTGTGLILDDNSERVYPIQMRPRKSWHAGGTPDAFE
ncbi:MAG: LAGLIDADG family homing endonuclease [Candidatus Nanohaloarchaea archaeon]